MLTALAQCSENGSIIVLGGNEFYGKRDSDAYEILIKEKANVEAFSELCRLQHIIVGSLYGSTNQRSAVTCKGDFPFPFKEQNVVYCFVSDLED